MKEMAKTAADFFAGIGLVGEGLRHGGWTVKYAVDYDENKKVMYENHFGPGHYHIKDVGQVSVKEVPDVALIHASFPCTDTSIAGSRGGIHNGESASFWKFIRILDEMQEKRPPIAMLENVEGLLTSNSGDDIRAVLEALSDLGYSVDIMLIDAKHFVPQSRVRLFIIGVLNGNTQNVFELEAMLQGTSALRPPKIQHVIRKNSHLNWHIRHLPALPERTTMLKDIVDQAAEWWPKERTEYLLNQMFDRHKQKINELMAIDEWSYATAFRRMRKRDGKSRSTAEIRTDGIAGCLRTPKGGSARQILIRAGKGRVDARLLNGIECARLMGVPDYRIKEDLGFNAVLFGFGDAVCASVVEWLAENYLNPAFEEIMLDYAYE
ncbi:DNA cytosine methyltransferase [soil metagenome]